eukprot:TRINITY_DN471_c0_g3_i2.p2 TRINITY_DN471_c0_g3~~TRINITY_DN471_c0_g3_i2.p2  ORF type:complete len:319 (+),score=174.33 TRINITY_DN471_c0_g3_i2:100-957(+)
MTTISPNYVSPMFDDNVDAAQKRAGALACALVAHGHGSRLVAQLDRRAALADVLARDEAGRTPLHYAAASGDAALVGVLAARAPAWRAAQDSAGTSPLLAGVRHAPTDAAAADVARALVSCGAPASVADDNGVAPLHVAVGAGRASTASLLLDAGALVGAADSRGATPLHYAAAHDGTDSDAAAAVVRLLLERGALLSARDEAGDAPLHWAARAGAAAPLATLLDAGADVLARNDDGETAADIAAVSVRAGQSGAEQCASLLASALAAVGSKNIAASIDQNYVFI